MKYLLVLIMRIWEKYSDPVCVTGSIHLESVMGSDPVLTVITQTRLFNRQLEQSRLLSFCSDLVPPLNDESEMFHSGPDSQVCLDESQFSLLRNGSRAILETTSRQARINEAACTAVRALQCVLQGNFSHYFQKFITTSLGPRNNFPSHLSTVWPVLSMLGAEWVLFAFRNKTVNWDISGPYRGLRT